MIACLLLRVGIQAQGLTLFDIDTSAFPSISAKFLAYDNALTRVRYVASDLVLKENGVTRTITNVSCPAPEPPRAISAVLTIDVSMSMATGPNAVPNLELAKAGARAWIAALPVDRSECAITKFDHENYFVEDFTNDAAKLTAAINALQAGGGTDYNKGLIRGSASALQATLSAKHIPVIVFLTDGVSEIHADQAAIIAEAKRQGCRIYVLTIAIDCPNELQNIATETGGRWYANINTTAEAKSVYEEILAVVQSGEPCTITWDGTPCPSGYRRAELIAPIATDTVFYEVSAASASKLVFLPKSIFYRPKALFTPYDTTITVTASNGSIAVTDITSSNPAYTIAPKSFALNPGQSITLTISYSPPDSGYTFTEFAFISNLCTEYYFASGGYAGQPARVPSLKVLQPNGGETFVAGVHATIKWAGVPSTANYRIEYSTNAGTEWRVITPSTSGLEYDWIVPNTPSTNCLVRVMSLANDGKDASGRIITFGVGDVVRWTPDGQRVLTASNKGFGIWNAFSGQEIQHIIAPYTSYDWSADATLLGVCGNPDRASLWSAADGTMVHDLIGHSRDVYKIRFSPDGTMVATCGLDNWSTIWDVSTGLSLHKLSGHSLPTNDLSWNPQSSMLASVSHDGSGIVYDASTGSEIPLRLANHTGEVSKVLWSPDGSRIATIGVDNQILIWNANMPHAELQAFSQPGIGRFSIMTWSPDGTRLLTINSTADLSIWNVITGQALTAITDKFGKVHDAQWSKDGKRLATCGTEVIIWDANTGVEIRRLPTNAWSVDFSPDGTLIATTASDGITIWGEVETPSLIDTSDALFAIVNSKADAKYIDMQMALVGASKDSTIRPFVSNIGSYQLRVDSIVITGSDSAEFAVVSGNGPYTLEAASFRAIEVRFMPTQLGMRYARLNVYTTSGDITVNLLGEGIQPRVEVVNNLIDFGQVAVGTSKALTNVTTIRNAGSSAMIISGVRHGGPNSTDFITSIVGQSFTLQACEEKHINIQFDANAPGRTSGMLLFDFAGTGSPASVQLFGEGTTSSVNQGKARVRIGTATAKDGDLVSIPITLESDSNLVGTGATVFTARLRFEAALLNPQAPLGAGTLSGLDRVIDLTIPFQPATANVLTTLQFIATTSLDSSTVIALENISVPGGRVTVTSESGEFRLLPSSVPSNENGTATIRVGSASARTGDIINIAITLIADSNLAATQATSFTATLHYNATLLEPLAPLTANPVVNNVGGVALTIPFTSDGTGALASVRFRTALGNDSVTSLTLDDLLSVGGSVRITSEPGEFHLDGICLAGGARLLNPNGAIELTGAGPNPVFAGHTNVTIATSEVGPTSLVLKDMQGRVVRTFFDGEVSSGRRVETLNFNGIASGAYLLVLRTPTEQRTIRIEIAQ